MASGADRVAASFVASPDQRSTSDLMRASQARLACSHASSNSFCTPSIASVCSGPNFAKGVEASVGFAVMTSLRSSLLMFDRPPTEHSLYNLLLAPARSCDPLQARHSRCDARRMARRHSHCRKVCRDIRTMAWHERNEEPGRRAHETSVDRHAARRRSRREHDETGGGPLGWLGVGFRRLRHRGADRRGAVAAGLQLLLSGLRLRLRLPGLWLRLWLP